MNSQMMNGKTMSRPMDTPKMGDPMKNEQMMNEKHQADAKLAKMYCEKHEKLKAARSTVESHWQECMDYIVPRKRDVITSRTQGDKRNNDLFDSTAILSNQKLASALHGMLTNPSTRFFDLVMGDAALDDDEEVKEWLQEVGDRMFTVMNNSNFQTEIHEVYIDLGAIGTACLYIGEHDENLVHFGARSMKEIYIDENNLGLIDTVHREFKWKPRQIVQEFGEENMHPFVMQKYRSGCDDLFTIIHCVHPMSDEEMMDHPKNFKIKSCYVLKEENIILSESGYKEFPYAVPRWTKTTGEQYGRGPGMDVLPDAKMVNKMMETTLQGAQMTIRPPMMVSDDGVIGKVRLTPGGLTVVRPGEPPIRPLITDARIDFGYQAVEDVRKRIRDGFYGDLFTLREGPQMTATEVNTIAEQQMRLMGPVLGRQHFECLRPTINRVFSIMVRRDKLPPAPSKIQGKAFDVRYSSLVARAQRMSEGQNLTRAIQVAAPIINAKPESLDVLNGDKSLKYIMDIYGVPHKIMNSSRNVQKSRDARAEAQQQALQQQQEMHGADMASKVMPGAAQMMQAQGMKK